MIYDIVTYGREELREKALSVDRVDDGIRSLVKDMLETMYASNGLGLAAEQVGRREAICVIDVPPDYDRTPDGLRANPDVAMPLALINPRITAMDGKQDGKEGCLSFPEIFVDVKRAMEVTVSFMDLEGREQSLTVRGLLSRAVQHELDHLAGMLLVDRMSPVQKVSLAGRLKRLKKQSRSPAT